jgi:ribose transport system substrate-binding protein
MVEHLQGVAVERLIDTGVTVVTPESMDDPEVQDLLAPPIERYLGQQ